MAIDPVCGMTVDERTSLKLEHNGTTRYFCSEHCLEKYASENKLDIPRTMEATTGVRSSWYKNKVVQMAMVIVALYVASGFLSVLSKLHDMLQMYLAKIALPVLVGLLLGGIIEWLVPREYISHILAGKKKRTIIWSVFTGFLMSACSHGILALTIQLYKKGSSTSSTVAFLLASPWANLPITILMFGFFGWKALYIVGSAIGVAIITGFVFQWLEQRQWVERNPNTVLTEDTFSIFQDIKQRARSIDWSLSSVVRALRSIWGGTVSLANMVLWWILLGALLSSLAGAFIPANFMHHYMGASFLGLLVTLLIATIMEVCSEGTAPLAFEIYRQTGAFGNVFVFLMAGVVTDYTEIGLLWTNVGPRTAMFMPAISVPLVIVLGVLFNVFII